MGITVSDMLQLEPLKSLRLLAGHNGLDRIIEQVSVLEIPRDFDQFFIGGEFVLTTFHSLSNDIDGQIEAIRKFSEFGVAALGIHPMASGLRGQDELMKAADKCGLPLLLLPPSMTYATVFSTVLGTILNRQSQILKKSEDINRELTRVILHGGNVGAIATTLSGLIKQPVIITNDLFEIHAEGSSSPEDSSFLQKCLQTQGFHEPIDLRKTGYSVNKTELGIECYSTWLEVEGIKVKQVAVPAGAANEPFGYIFIWEIGDSLQELDLIAISHASTALSLEIAKQRAVAEAESRLRSDFLTEVLEGKFTREEDLYSRGTSVGLNLMKKHMLLIARLEREEAAESSTPMDIIRLEKRIRSMIRPVVEKHGPKSEVMLKGDSIFVFNHFGRSLERHEARQKTRNLALFLKETLESELASVTISVGIGDYYPSPLHLGLSYRDALQAIDVGRRMFGPGSITAIQDLGVYGILGELPQTLLGEFTSGLLELLYQYDAKNQTDLVKTVETYLDEKESFTDVAKRLFVHPNTVKYRIEKVREVLGFDPFKQPEQRLNLHLALKARRLLP
ncbi:PucR family transcriptional regulator [Ammoniphilus sp. YIM 78166]|uniref:PucR family transcriptional regulator n=1 Tax=Ammoniphilus sp. YIM 78166 TaxID=1644106 RepID=UPI0010705BFC|nr:PucR family transcriptional regulator [Ammoniphilus sp. YIM 78166]